MNEVVIFGGTTEGRQLAEFCSRTWTPALVCVATELGQDMAPSLRGVTYHVGRLDKDGIADLLRQAAPPIVVDATHPYAAAVTANLAAACAELGLPYLRVHRPDGQTALGGDMARFADIADAVAWLNGTPGVVFAAIGAKELAGLTRVADFAGRVVVRILPTAEGVRECLALGYPGEHVVAMQGPFGHDLNAALFRHFKASILLTKDSGEVGGFGDKVTAARECGMRVAVIARPADGGGVGLEEAEGLITKATLG